MYPEFQEWLNSYLRETSSRKIPVESGPPGTVRTRWLKKTLLLASTRANLNGKQMYWDACGSVFLCFYDLVFRLRLDLICFVSLDCPMRPNLRNGFP